MAHTRAWLATVTRWAPLPKKSQCRDMEGPVAFPGATRIWNGYEVYGKLGVPVATSRQTALHECKSDTASSCVLSHGKHVPIGLGPEHVSNVSDIIFPPLPETRRGYPFTSGSVQQPRPPRLVPFLRPLAQQSPYRDKRYDVPAGLPNRGAPQHAQGPQRFPARQTDRLSNQQAAAAARIANAHRGAALNALRFQDHRVRLAGLRSSNVHHAG